MKKSSIYERAYWVVVVMASLIVCCEIVFVYKIIKRMTGGEEPVRLTLNWEKPMKKGHRPAEIDGIRKKFFDILIDGLVSKDDGKSITAEKEKNATRRRIAMEDTRMKSLIEEWNPNMMAATTSNFNWITLSKALHIYSTYYDRRIIKSGNKIYPRSVVVFGFERGRLSDRLHCVYTRENNARLLEREPAERVVLAEDSRNGVRRYRAIQYRCNVTTKEVPRHVTLVESGSEQLARLDSIPFRAFSSIVDSYVAEPPHEFGVCYERPLDGSHNDQDIVDSIEMNRVLGATWFTVYVFEANAKTSRILHYYSKREKILDAVGNWGVNLPRPVNERGLWNAVNECVYRSMYKVRYLVLCDFDEVVAPLKAPRWHEMLPQLEASKRAYFVFGHQVYRSGGGANETKGLPCPKNERARFKMPRFFSSYRRRSLVVPEKYQRAKSIAKPVHCTSVRVQWRRDVVSGYGSFNVPHDVAILKRYRNSNDKKPPNATKHEEATMDVVMDKFKPRVLRAVESSYCRFARETKK